MLGSGVTANEENVPAKPATAQPYARLSRANAIEGGPGGVGATKAQGASSSGRLTGSAPRPKREKLRRRADFERTYQNGKRLVNPLFVAFVRATSEGRLRVAFVASRKVGGAVQRNRAKRLLREVFRREGPKREVSADVVLVARGPIASVGYFEVEAAYQRGLGRWFEKALGPPG
jgi:ribonuclease P protein component